MSCAGEIGSEDSFDLPGSKAGANGAGQPVSGSAGHTGSGSAGQPVSGSAGQPVSGSAGQPVSGSAGQGGSGSVVVPPSTGAAGQSGGGSAVPPTTGTAGQPTTGAAGQGGSGSVVPPAGGATGQAGTGSVTPPVGGATGQAGTGSVTPPVTGAGGQAGTGSAGRPTTTGTAGQAGSSVTPPVGGAAGTTATPSTTAAATIVPLYTSPSDSSWSTVIAAKTAHPKVGVVAIVNPSNGPGGSASSAYASGIARLTAAGIKVIGYVSTDYTNNSAATVKADIDRWKTFYPGQLGGIFFDEQSNQASDVAYYRDLSQYAKAQGLSFTVGNPGTDTAEGYVGALDMMLIYESGGLPAIDRIAGWHANHPPSNFGIIPYAAALDTTFVRNARKYVQYIYLQNDNLPNPWDSVPSYFGDLLAALE